MYIQFEVLLKGDLKTSGVVLSDHVKNLNWKARRIKFVESLPNSLMQQVLDRLRLLL